MNVEDGIRATRYAIDACRAAWGAGYRAGVRDEQRRSAADVPDPRFTRTANPFASHADEPA